VKITRRQLRRLIKEELNLVLTEGEPSGARQVPQDARDKILGWMNSTRLSMKGTKYKSFSGHQKLVFVLKDGGSVSIETSTEWQNSTEMDEKRSKANAAPLTSGHESSFKNRIQSSMKGKDPGTYTMGYST
jgi:hypothetical protein